MPETCGGRFRQVLQVAHGVNATHLDENPARGFRRFLGLKNGERTMNEVRSDTSCLRRFLLPMIASAVFWKRTSAVFICSEARGNVTVLTPKMADPENERLEMEMVRSPIAKSIKRKRSNCSSCQPP